jgi:GNAT superfamily N-acetyltransferase
MTARVDIVRSRTVNECGSVRALAEAHARFERSATVLPENWAERIARFVAAGQLDVFVAIREGVAVGYASSTVIAETWSAGTFTDLDCLFISEQWRGSGIGRMLLEAVSAHAITDGCRELQWQTPAWNVAAIGFYERIGARHTTKERFSLALDVG